MLDPDQHQECLFDFSSDHYLSNHSIRVLMVFFSVKPFDDYVHQTISVIACLLAVMFYHVLLYYKCDCFEL